MVVLQQNKCKKCSNLATYSINGYKLCNTCANKLVQMAKSKGYPVTSRKIKPVELLKLDIPVHLHEYGI